MDLDIDFCRRSLTKHEEQKYKPDKHTWYLNDLKDWKFWSKEESRLLIYGCNTNSVTDWEQTSKNKTK